VLACSGDDLSAADDPDAEDDFTATSKRRGTLPVRDKAQVSPIILASLAIQRRQQNGVREAWLCDTAPKLVRKSII
jgi:hypothetical protein